MSMAPEGDRVMDAIEEGPRGFHERLSEVVDELESRVAAEIAQEALENDDSQAISDQ